MFCKGGKILQGRKSSRRKSRGCKSTPSRFTEDGNADRRGGLKNLMEVRRGGLIMDESIWGMGWNCQGCLKYTEKERGCMIYGL